MNSGWHQRGHGAMKTRGGQRNCHGSGGKGLFGVAADQNPSKCFKDCSRAGDGSVVRTTGCSSRVPGFNSQQPYGN